ncbi:hypothetical protein GQ53DRAFT_825865 [Thozetella sp. PMI_491]|nr:hypothetical protein GQ53DRAFT_825865 [Thozetella sp. PMI_491]
MNLKALICHSHVASVVATSFSQGYIPSGVDQLNFAQPACETVNTTRTPSHVVGIWQATSYAVGPDTGVAPNPANVWTVQIPASAFSSSATFLLLHFSAATLPGENTISIDLGNGDIDVFTSADTFPLWTRPINFRALPGKSVAVTYTTNGATTGGALIDNLGVGEPHNGSQYPSSMSNCDPFLVTTPYVDPIFDPTWFCTPPANWTNAACVKDPNGVRARVSRSVGMIIVPENEIPSQYQDPTNPFYNTKIISTCSVTLIDTDLVILAGHCLSDQEAIGSSVIFGYETDCNFNRPSTYAPKFFKVKEAVSIKYVTDGVNYPYDWAILRLETSPPGIPPIQLRSDLPVGDATTGGNGEQVFGLHHPNGAVMKLSIPDEYGFAHVVSSTDARISVTRDVHVSGGSSGSGLFDTAGRLLGVLSNGAPCYGGSYYLNYYPAATIIKDMTPQPPQPVSRDVMVVFDRSGSMIEMDATGRSKIEVARDAVSLFVQLVRAGAGGNKIGFVSFNTFASSPVDFALADATDTNKAKLIGTAPYSSGIVGGLKPSGSTSIGDGLEKAIGQFATGGSVNPRAILLMTDGMENTFPLISDAEQGLSDNNIAVHAVGFGAATNLDGVKLSQLATRHGGLYSAAETGVALMKFFSLAFGNIFETGILQDPDQVLPAGAPLAQPVEFRVCKEDAVTLAVGWDLDISRGGDLRVNVTTPSGHVIGGLSPNVEEQGGRAWAFLRGPLPYNDEQEGRWNYTVYRIPLPPVSRFRALLRAFKRLVLRDVPPALTYFVNVIPTGGPTLRVAPDPETNRTFYYTGDRINPLVYFGFADGTWIDEANVQLTMGTPNVSVGTILASTGLHAPDTNVSGDTIPAAQQTLKDLGIAVGLLEQSFPLDNGAEGSGGYLEPTGVYGRMLNNSLVVEGDFFFHAVASSLGDDDCVYTREVLWSVHVGIGIDAAFTDVTLANRGSGSGGQSIGVAVVTPKDRYGNYLGPGRSADVTWEGVGSAVVTGAVVDNNNGLYSVPISWNSSAPPGLVMTQPGRSPVSIRVPV